MLKRWPAFRPSRTELNTGTSPIGVFSFWPPRPGEVPKTTLPPEKAWLTGVTSLHLAAQDVEHADPVLARRDLGQRVDADEVFEARNALLVHGCVPDRECGWFRRPCACRGAARPARARRAFIQRSAAWA